MVVWKYFYVFYTSLRKYYNLFVCLFRIIDDYFATYRFEIFRFCLCWCLFKNIDQDGLLFNFLSISGKAWYELGHSSHNEILTALSWFPSSGYFKIHWGLKLFLNCHRRSQNVYFFLLGTNHFIKHSGVFFRNSCQEVFCEKRRSWKFHKIHRKTPAPESFLIKLQAKTCNLIK